MAVPANPYKILQVDEQASTEVIVAAYRRLAKMSHPDLGLDDADQAARTARTAVLNDARDQLVDPAKRRKVDEEIDREVTFRRAEDLANRARATATTDDDRASWTVLQKIRLDRKAENVVAAVAALWCLAPLFDQSSDPFVYQAARGLTIFGMFLVAQALLAWRYDNTPLASLIHAGQWVVGAGGRLAFVAVTEIVPTHNSAALTVTTRRAPNELAGRAKGR